MPPPRRERNPWPIKWVLLTIIAVLVPYTWLTLHYRKPGHAFEPYHDLKQRATVGRLLAAGYQRVTLEATRPADTLRVSSSAAVFPAPGGLPEELERTLIDKPTLPIEFSRVHAADAISAHEPYVIELACSLPDHKEQLAGAYLYVREGDLVIAPDFERLDGNLLTRTDDTTALLTIPAGALKPGRYHVVLAGQRSSRAWSLQVH